MNTNSKEVIKPSLLTDYKTSNTSYYITGVLDSFPSEFIIGDNITYDYNGSYINAPLDHDLIRTSAVHIGYVFYIRQV